MFGRWMAARSSGPRGRNPAIRSDTRQKLCLPCSSWIGCRAFSGLPAPIVTHDAASLAPACTKYRSILKEVSTYMSHAVISAERYHCRLLQRRHCPALARHVMQGGARNRRRGRHPPRSTSSSVNGGHGTAFPATPLFSSRVSSVRDTYDEAGTGRRHTAATDPSGFHPYPPSGNGCGDCWNPRMPRPPGGQARTRHPRASENGYRAPSAMRTKRPKPG